MEKCGTFNSNYVGSTPTGLIIKLYIIKGKVAIGRVRYLLNIVFRHLDVRIISFPGTVCIVNFNYIVWKKIKNIYIKLIKFQIYEFSYCSFELC